MAREDILLIEDEPRWQRELRRILEEGGYQVHVVDSYAGAVELLKQRTARVAVVDVSLEPGDAYDRQGLQVMAEAGIPVVCVSGYLTDEEVADVLRTGEAEWFFAKQSFAGKEDTFLDAVGYALVVSEKETRDRWRALRNRVLVRGD